MELNIELDRLQKFAKIDRELTRAEHKHPNFPTDLFHQLAIMQEEAGEVTKAVLQYNYENGSIDHIREELIQTAAMCVRMLQNLPSGMKQSDGEKKNRQSAVFHPDGRKKSVVMLDRNFHLYIHGDHSRIFEGDDNYGNFIKIYYDEAR